MSEVVTAEEVKKRIKARCRNFSGTTIKGNLYLGGATIKGELNLTTKKGPTQIFVSPSMAQLIHWAAPTIPMVVIK